MSRILWDHFESQYRGQAHSGCILTIEEAAMQKALKNAGNSVFETEWWVETLGVVLEHWGLKSKRWTDPATQMPHVHYALVNENAPNGPMPRPSVPLGTGPLTNRILNSGKLNSGNLNSGGLNSGNLDSGNLDSGRLNADKLRDLDKDDSR